MPDNVEYDIAVIETLGRDLVEIDDRNFHPDEFGDPAITVSLVHTDAEVTKAGPVTAETFVEEGTHVDSGYPFLVVDTVSGDGGRLVLRMPMSGFVSSIRIIKDERGHLEKVRVSYTMGYKPKGVPSVPATPENRAMLAKLI